MRSTRVRYLASILGLAGALAVPALALAHGHAHHEAAEHAAHHAVLAAVHQSAVSAYEYDEEHGHPRLGPGALSRIGTLGPALQAEGVGGISTHHLVLDRSDPPRPNESPPDRPPAAPTRSRAPPAL